MSIQSFILRFYRFQKDKPEEAVGTLQQASTGRQVHFHGLSDLWIKIGKLYQPRKPSQTPPPE